MRRKGEETMIAAWEKDFKKRKKEKYERKMRKVKKIIKERRKLMTKGKRQSQGICKYV